MKTNEMIVVEKFKNQSMVLEVRIAYETGDKRIQTFLQQVEDLFRSLDSNPLRAGKDLKSGGI